MKECTFIAIKLELSLKEMHVAAKIVPLQQSRNNQKTTLLV